MNSKKIEFDPECFEWFRWLNSVVVYNSEISVFSNDNNDPSILRPYSNNLSQITIRHFAKCLSHIFFNLMTIKVLEDCKTWISYKRRTYCCYWRLPYGIFDLIFDSSGNMMKSSLVNLGHTYQSKTHFNRSTTAHHPKFSYNPRSRLKFHLSESL